MSGKEHTDIYTIPPNFAKEGTILSGRVETRNAVEAVLLVFLLFQLLMAMKLSVRGRIYAGVILILPTAIFAVIGVQGESIFSFVFHFIQYLVRRRVLTVPNGQYRLKRSRRILKKQKKQQRREQKRKKQGGVRNRKRSQRIETEIETGEKRRKRRTEEFKEKTP